MQNIKKKKESNCGLEKILYIYKRGHITNPIEMTHTM